MQVLLNPITQEEAAIEGLCKISDFLTRCRFIENELLRYGCSIGSQGWIVLTYNRPLNDTRKLHTFLKAKTVDMYAKILKYQMQFAITVALRENSSSIILWSNMTGTV